MSEFKVYKKVVLTPKYFELFKYIYFVLHPKTLMPLILSIVGFLFSFFIYLLDLYKVFGTSTSSTPFLLIPAVIAFISFYFFVREAKGIYQRLFGFIGHNLVTHPQAYKTLKGIKETVQVPNQRGQYVILNNEIDLWLLEQPIISMIEKQNFHDELRRRLRAKATEMENLIRVQFRISRESNKKFNNDIKICLQEDIVKDMDKCHYYNGTYWDSFCTNEYCTQLIETIDSSPIDVTDGFNKFPCDDYGKLKKIEKSDMNNHIGISTLAFTSDGFVRLWRQDEKNYMSPGDVVATGSGSLDADDLAPSNNLLETIYKGMEREFIKESSKKGTKLELSAINETKVLGYFRWVKRGGKPEFVGITRLNVPHDKLFPNPDEVNDPKYAGLLLDASCIKELKESLEETLDNNHELSVSCWVALKKLQEVAENNPQELKGFVNEV